MSAYDDDKAMADEEIAESGMSATLKRPTTSGPAYNPTIGTPTSYAVNVVVQEYRNAEIDGARVQAGDKKVMMAKGSLAIEPDTSDKLVIGGVDHAIVEVRPLNPGGTVLLYEMQVRR